MNSYLAKIVGHKNWQTIEADSMAKAALEASRILHRRDPITAIQQEATTPTGTGIFVGWTGGKDYTRAPYTILVKPSKITI